MSNKINSVNARIKSIVATEDSFYLAGEFKDSKWGPNLNYYSVAAIKLDASWHDMSNPKLNIMDGAWSQPVAASPITYDDITIVMTEVTSPRWDPSVAVFFGTFTELVYEDISIFQIVAEPLETQYYRVNEEFSFSIPGICHAASGDLTWEVLDKSIGSLPEWMNFDDKGTFSGTTPANIQTLTISINLSNDYGAYYTLDFDFEILEESKCTDKDCRQCEADVGQC